MNKYYNYNHYNDLYDSFRTYDTAFFKTNFFKTKVVKKPEQKTDISNLLEPIKITLNQDN